MFTTIDSVSSRRTSKMVRLFLIFLFLRFFSLCEGNGNSSVWCPKGRFPKDDGTCQLCFAYCGKSGCTGPSDLVGTDGCKTCWKGLEINSTHIKCILPYLPGCSAGYYLEDVPTHSTLPLAGSKLCRQCHTLCETCTGPGVANCLQCKFYKLHYLCVDECPADTNADEERRVCVDKNDNPQRTMMQYIYNTSVNQSSVLN